MMIGLLLASAVATPCPGADTVVYACEADGYGAVDQRLLKGSVHQVDPTRDYTVGAKLYSDEHKDLSVNYRLQDATGYRNYRPNNSVGVTLRIKFR